MSASNNVTFIDGISSISTHNGVHRIVFYRLSPDQHPEPSVELIVPDSSLRGIVDAIARVQMRR